MIKPPKEKGDALPYNLDVLRRSYDALPSDCILEEMHVQEMLDKVYPQIEVANIDYSGAIYVNGEWQIKQLCHHGKSALLDVLDIDVAVCNVESNREFYEQVHPNERIKYEIPISYKEIAKKKLDV